MLTHFADEVEEGKVFEPVVIIYQNSSIRLRVIEVEELLEASAGTEGAVRVRGLMTLAPLVEDPEDVRYVFAKLRTIRDRLRESWSPRFDLSELSMGMSGDYEVAVEEGATVVRIGRMLIEEDGPVRRQDGS